MIYRVTVTTFEGTRRFPVVEAESVEDAQRRAEGIWTGGKAGHVEPAEAVRLRGRVARPTDEGVLYG